MSETTDQEIFTVHLQEIGNNQLYLLWTWTSITHEKEINHWHDQINMDLVIWRSLFLISSNGVPRHWTTSVNNGDTLEAVFEPFPSGTLTVLTVVSHRNIRNNFLQNSFSFREFFVLRFGRLKVGTKLLFGKGLYWSQKSSCGAQHTSIFPRWKNLASWPAWAICRAANECQEQRADSGGPNRLFHVVWCPGIPSQDRQYTHHYILRSILS